MPDPTIYPNSIKRLAFLPISIVIALIAIRFELTYSGLAVLVGIALPFFDRARSRAMPIDDSHGFLWVAFGVVILGIAYLVSNHYALSLEALDHDQSFPRLIRRLPYFGIAFMTMGATILALSFLRKRQA